MAASPTPEPGECGTQSVGESRQSAGRISIGVFPVSVYRRHKTLLDALEDLFFVRFHPCHREDLGGFRFAILGGPTREHLTAAQEGGVRCLVLPSDTKGAETCPPGAAAFRDVPEIDGAIRGQRFDEHESLRIAAIATRPGTVLATRSGAPIWIRSACGRASVDYLAVAPPALEAGTLLREQLHRHSVSPILPLLHFAREAAGEANWESGPRHACLVIDDPSLYRPSYGCVRFEQLADHATRHGYHVAIATIPLDTWRIHRDVVSAFRNHPKHLSLIIHGNNHTRRELCRPTSNGYYLSELAQALRRYSRMEQQYGLRFGKVSEAPHGVISSETFDPLMRLGYEAALCTPSQFIAHNRNQGWRASFGSTPVTVSPQGLCLIPRLVISPGWRADVSIAAFLRQPIVLAGHQRDLVAGVEAMSGFAAGVTALGHVHWSDLSAIARSRFISRRDGSCWILRLGSRTVECRVPSDVTDIVIERPWISGSPEPLKLTGVTDASEPLRLMAGAVSPPVRWRRSTGGELTIESPLTDTVSPDTVASPPTRAWPWIRKILVEARDRAYPVLPGAARRVRATLSLKKRPPKPKV